MSEHENKNIKTLERTFDGFETIVAIRKENANPEAVLAQVNSHHPYDAPFGPLTKIDHDDVVSEVYQANDFKVDAHVSKLISELPKSINPKELQQATKSYIESQTKDLTSEEYGKLQSRLNRYAQVLLNIPEPKLLKEVLERTLVSSIDNPRVGKTFYDTVGVSYEVAQSRKDPKTGRPWISFEDPRALRGRSTEKTISKQAVREVTYNSDGTVTAEIYDPAGKTITFNPDDESHRIIENDDGKKELVHYIPANRMSFASALNNSPTAQMIVRSMGLSPEEFGIHTADISDNFRPVTDNEGNLIVNPRPITVAKTQ
ncbi:MAG: hypothetical protein JWN26_109 [Candidatus Saccharibacteria bacterium]|nr:hypothetical protein [Candidatus Saccharibacteria bacterium]